MDNVLPSIAMYSYRDYLTLVVPTRGRDLFTLRFLLYANRINLPFFIIIADGAVDPKFAELLETKAGLFPNIRYSYIRYPDDVSFSHFYRKMADTIRRVHTPYTMLVDNDDFPCPAGICEDIAFLEANPDYVSCGGGVAGFEVAVGSAALPTSLVGPIQRFMYRYSRNYLSRDLNNSNLTERVLDGFRDYMTTYYNVFRTDALATIHDEFVELDLTDLELHESYFSMRALTLGKARSNPSTISYLRQNGTSMASAFGKSDWVHHLLHSRFTSDFDAMAKRLSAICAASDDVDPTYVEEEIRQIFATGLRISLARRYGQSSSSSTWRHKLANHTPHWLRRARKLGTRLPKRSRQDLFERLRASGAEASYINTFSHELQAMADSLDGTQFEKFVYKHARQLLAG